MIFIYKKDVMMKKTEKATKVQEAGISFKPTKNDIFVYYKLFICTKSELLATNPAADIMNEHIIQKAKKLMAEASRKEKRVSKALDKYAGEQDICGDKAYLDLRYNLQAYMSLIGSKAAVPESAEELLDLFAQVKEEFDEMVAQGKAQQGTIFLRNNEGKVVLSSHMILGNIKEILSNITNNGDKSILATKVSVGETCAQDIKWVNAYAEAKQIEDGKLVDRDSVKDAEGKPVMLQRSLRIRNPQPGQAAVCISMSEYLPEETIFEFTLRVRKKSVFDKNALEYIFHHGISLGLGQWRGSGGKGAYEFHLEELPDFTEEKDGWKKALGLK